MRQETPTFHGHLLSLMKYLGWNISWKVLTTQSNSTFGSCWCWNIGNNVCLIVSYYQLFSGCCQIFKQNKSFFFLSFLICKTLFWSMARLSPTLHDTTLLNSWHLHAPTITKIINDPYSYYNIIKLSIALKYAHFTCSHFQSSYINITLVFVLVNYSDKKNGSLALICELMDMNLYELIRGKHYSNKQQGLHWVLVLVGG